MDKELETYYNNYFDLFLTEGWKQLVGELSTNAQQVNSLETVKDEADMHFRKGQLNILANIINFESLIENAHKNIEEDND